MSTTRGTFVEFEDGESLTAGGCDAAWYASILTASAVTSSSSYDYAASSSEADHFVTRVLCLANLVKPGSGTESFVLDDTVDWRDRLCVMLGCRTATAVVPGHPSDATLNANENKTVFYTGEGEAAEQASVPDYGKVISSTGWWVYADATTGALKIDAPTGASAAVLSGVFQMFAGPRLNEKITIATPLTIPIPTAVDDASVTPMQLNYLQDAGVMKQCEADGSDTIPLGPECFGDPPIPSEWTVRNVVVRQPIAGQIWRFFSMDLAIGEARNIDASVDWRDRLVSLAMALNTASNALPGSAGDTTISETDAVAYRMSTFYSGPGDVGAGTDYVSTAGSVVICADPDDGALYITNGSAFTARVVGMVLATPVLGPRTVGA